MPDAGDCDAIVLAAGLSSRMPGSKMLREIDGRPLVRVAVENALSACARAIVVLGHEASAVEAALGEPPPGVVIVENARYREGMFGSIQTGMREVESDWFFVVPGDMPGLDAGIFAAVARAVSPDALAVVPYYGAQRGHPVLVSRSLVPALLREPRSAGPMRDLDRKSTRLNSSHYS